MTDVPTTKRARMTDAKRMKVWETYGGICHVCTRKIQSGEKWDVEHVRPLALGGPDDLPNMRPVHVDCHKGKTRADAASIAKAKRMKRKHLGLTGAKARIPGSRGTKWKRKLDGTTVRREDT